MSNEQEKVRVVTPQQVVASHENYVRQSLKKHGLKATIKVQFPNRPRPPLIGRLGAWIVNKAGGTLALTYTFDDTIISEPSPEEQ